MAEPGLKPPSEGFHYTSRAPLKAPGCALRGQHAYLQILSEKTSGAGAWV